MGSGDSVVNEEKEMCSGGSVNGGENRHHKCDGGVAWGKLLSQSSQVGFCTFMYSVVILVIVCMMINHLTRKHVVFLLNFAA